jgi:hypothetical protein
MRTCNLAHITPTPPENPRLSKRSSRKVPSIKYEDPITMNYRAGIEQALRSVTSAYGGYVCSDVVSLEGLRGLPSISVQGVGRLSLPLQEHQQGERGHRTWRWPCACMFVVATHAARTAQTDACYPKARRGRGMPDEGFVRIRAQKQSRRATGRRNMRMRARLRRTRLG